ncbi:THAP domain-containing protein 6-like [Schistocerca americana]|uniref:THAP domain-containing protein 6-like n=1 Tax=Schistocerca americana TaxID=7009 RepID=UPI001F4FDF8D|nr:THAP domain-containing protein 6-like [Schistocerca americana]
MPACAVVGCTARSDRSQKCLGITFHKFPSNATRKDLWVKALGRKDWEPSKYSKVCSQHFREQDIDRTSVSTVRIRENAVPSIFPAFPAHRKVLQ